MKFLIDNSVLHAWMNTRDPAHSRCKAFFDTHIHDELFFPIHCLFEYHASCRRRLKGNKFDGLLGRFELKNQKFIDVNRVLYDSCQKQNLFDLFSDLKGGDLIYACIARLGSYTLVTCDSDFDQYGEIISLVKL